MYVIHNFLDEIQLDFDVRHLREIDKCSRIWCSSAGRNRTLAYMRKFHPETAVCNVHFKGVKNARIQPKKLCFHGKSLAFPRLYTSTKDIWCGGKKGKFQHVHKAVWSFGTWFTFSSNADLRYLRVEWSAKHTKKKFRCFWYIGKRKKSSFWCLFTCSLSSLRIHYRSWFSFPVLGRFVGVVPKYIGPKCIKWFSAIRSALSLISARMYEKIHQFTSSPLHPTSPSMSSESQSELLVVC